MRSLLRPLFLVSLATFALPAGAQDPTATLPPPAESVAPAETPAPAEPAPAPSPPPPAAPAPAAGEEENLLAGVGEPAAGTEPLEIDDDASSFGQALSALGIRVVWSGYGDLVFSAKQDGEVTFDASHFNPIVGAAIGDVARAELELEFEHAGTEIKVEYGFFEYQPVQWFTLRAGQFLVPIGRFNDELHPSFRWNQISRPTMFRNLIPGVWSDVGLQAYGRVMAVDAPIGVNYALYVINGLGHDEDFNPAPEKEPIRKMKGGAIDTNIDKAAGARFGFHALSGLDVGDLIVGVSGYTGAIDPAGEQRLSIVDLDAQVRLWALLLRAEFAQSSLATGTSFIPFEQGAFVQAGLDIWRFNIAARWDYLRSRPGLADLATVENAFIASLMFSPQLFWSVRAEVGVPFDGDWALKPVTGRAMLAFSF